MPSPIAICADDQLCEEVVRALDAGGPQIASASQPSAVAGSEMSLLVVTDGGESTLAEAMASDPRVVAAAARSVGATGLAALAGALQRGLGIADRVPAGTRIQSMRVASYDDKRRCLDKIERFASRAKLRGKHREAIALCADEMLMNALYSAPREAAGEMAADSEAIAARARRGVLVRWARAGTRFYVSALDGYGSLDRRSLVRAWRRAAPGDNASSAPGLGMHLIAGSSSATWFRRAPGTATECTCVFDLDAARVYLSQLAIVDETDPARIADLERDLAEASVPVPEVVELVSPQPRRAVAQAAVATAVLAAPVALAVGWSAAGLVAGLLAAAAGVAVAALLIASNLRAASSVRIDGRGVRLLSPLGLGRAIGWDELVDVTVEPASGSRRHPRLTLEGRSDGVRPVTLELVGDSERFAQGARRLVENARGRAELLAPERLAELVDWRRTLPAGPG